MNQITPQIFIGSSRSALDGRSLKSNGIANILNCAEDLSDQLGWDGGFRVFRVGMADGSNNPSLYKSALSVLDAVTSDSNKKILVHCHEGRSRSVYVVACWLVQRKLQGTIQDAIEFIRSCGRDVNVAQGHLNSFTP